MKVTGRCGRTFVKKGSSLLILKTIGTLKEIGQVSSDSKEQGYKLAAAYPYRVKFNSWRLLVSRERFAASRTLFVSPWRPDMQWTITKYSWRTSPNAVCVRSDKASMVGQYLRSHKKHQIWKIEQHTCNDWSLSKALLQGKDNWRTGRGVSDVCGMRALQPHGHPVYSPDVEDYENKYNFTKVREVCGAARMVWHLPKSLNGVRVLAPMGSKRYRVDNGQLNSTKPFLAYRPEGWQGRHKGVKMSFGVAWGKVVKAIAEDSDWISVQVGADKRCTPVVFEMAYGEYPPSERGVCWLPGR